MLVPISIISNVFDLLLQAQTYIIYYLLIEIATQSPCYLCTVQFSVTGLTNGVKRDLLWDPKLGKDVI